MMDHLIKKVDLLLISENILEGYDSNTSCLYEINQQLSLMKVKIEELRNILDEQKSQISECKELLNTLNYTEKLIHHVNGNLPDRYPGIEPVKLFEISEESHISPIRGNPICWNDLSPDFAEVIGKQRTASRSCVLHVTLEEFNGIPRYLRGRLNYQTINKFIDSVNVTLKKKYEIFGQPRETLRGKMLSVYDAFKKQETSETIAEGIYFCTADNLKTYGNIKMDRNSQNILNILRAAKRIREIRTPGLVRYAVFS